MGGSAGQVKPSDNKKSVERYIAKEDDVTTNKDQIITEQSLANEGIYYKDYTTEQWYDTTYAEVA